MSHEHPDHLDAELVLRVYELRREELMRKSRDALMREFWPRTYEDVKAVTSDYTHPLNAAYRQVGTYWEMVYGLVRHGIVNAEYFLESNGEGLFLFGKVQPFLEQIRQDGSPRSFANAEWVATQCAAGRGMYETIRARLQKMAEARAKG